ncbi:hypothetical protein ACPD8N_01170 [Lacticaseibacillus chiayiensis]|uniref:hypothetical protein n=2 Tax=Lacticaseibacillus chiayiensis TaxID=2100821 RepID=UPI001EE12C57|nr:hypothetical protein [Lacticaseibacillus chiayiensis]
MDKWLESLLRFPLALSKRMFDNGPEVNIMIAKLEDYQFPLRGEDAASYLDLVIQQRTGRKTKSHSIASSDLTLTSTKDVENIINVLQHPIGIADCTR